MWVDESDTWEVSVPKLKKKILFSVKGEKSKKKNLHGELGWDERNGREVAFMIIKENQEITHGTKNLQNV